jgi:nucleotide-binding universal stress UspA family protein
MKTLLVPIDFSPNSDHTISYSVEWAMAYEYERIILLNAQEISIFNHLILSTESADSDEEFLQKRQYALMERVRKVNELLSKKGIVIPVFSVISEKSLLRSVVEIVETEKPDLIIVGSDPQSGFSGNLVSQNVIAIAKASPVRVLVVPSCSVYQPVTKVLLPLNFKPISSLKKMGSYETLSSKWKNIMLYILHIDNRPEEPIKNETQPGGERALHEYLKDFPHQLFYIYNKSIVSGILDFSHEHEIQLLIALPSEQSFLYNLTHKSISNAISRNSKIPVLILK